MVPWKMEEKKVPFKIYFIPIMQEDFLFLFFFFHILIVYLDEHAYKIKKVKV